MICKVLHSLLFLLVFSAIGIAQEYRLEFIDQPFDEASLKDMADDNGDGDNEDKNSPFLPAIPLEGVTDSLTNYAVSQNADHRVQFLYPTLNYQPEGLYRTRWIGIAFPAGFDLSAIDTVTLTETDPVSNTPDIKAVWVYRQTVLIYFAKNLPDFQPGTKIFIDLGPITNPAKAREYTISVRLINRFGMIIAGPTPSEPFSIAPGDAATLEIRPSNDTTLRAGAGIYFQAFMVDQFGNELETADADWMLDPSMDDIGTIYGSFLQVTVPGEGRVMAKVDTLEARSGVITVLPGTAAVVSIETDAFAVNRGEPLANDITVEIRDRFGNRKTDFTGPVWFTSSDPFAEILHNETNPYQFTSQDAGRAVFAGSEFVFGTIGVQALTVTDGSLSASTRIAVLEPEGGDGTFDVVVPLTITAGEPFDIIIENAVDSGGNPFSGVVTVMGGRIAPDGSEPSLPQISVANGQGSGTAILYGAGNNPLLMVSSIGARSITTVVTPGDLGTLAMNIDRIQFLGNPLRGTAQVGAFDLYDNRKTNMSSSGLTLSLGSSDGELAPDTVGAGQFDNNGKADLSAYSYSGMPGVVVIDVYTSSSDPIIRGTAEVDFNGLYLAVHQGGDIPEWIPTDWAFTLRGEMWNPGSLSVDSSGFEVGFVGSGSPGPHIFDPDCDPLPNMASSCFVNVDQAAAGPAGIYPYRFVISAYYTIDNEEVIATWTYSKSVEIRDFIPFTVDDFRLPDTVLQAGYTFFAEGVIRNDNAYSEPVALLVELNLETVSDMIQLGFTETPWFEWPSQLPLFLSARFRENFEAKTYDYLTRIYASYMSPEGNFRTQYIHDIPLMKQVEIVPRAALSIDPATISPASVPAGAAMPFDLIIELTGASVIDHDTARTILTVTDGAVSSMTRLNPVAPGLVPGSNSVRTGMLTIPYSWEGKTLSAQLHVIGSEDGLVPVDTVIDFAFPVTVEAAGAAVQGLALVNNAPNSPFVNTGQQFILNGSFVNLTTSDLTGPFVLTLRTDGESDVPPGVTIPEIAAYDTVKIAFAVTAAGSPSPAEVFSMQIDAPQMVSVIPAIDDNAVAVIQTAAEMEILAEIPGKADPTAVLAYGESFDIVATIVNTGQAQVRDGRVVLRYAGPGDFGIGFPSELPSDSQVVWSLTAPNDDIVSRFSVAWATIPTDRNTGKAAIIANDSVLLPFTVRAPETRLIVNAGGFTTQPLVRGRTSKLFDFDVENVTNDSRNIVALRSIVMEFSDRDGALMDPWEIMADTGTNFYIDGEPVAVPEPVIVIPEAPRYAVVFTFENVLLDPGGAVTMEFRLTPKDETERDYFNIRITGNMVDAEIASGPQAGESVPVIGALDRSFEVNIPQSIIPNEFAASFKNYPNPFNPNREETEIRYNLPTDSDVDIHIYTATGERVRRLHFDAGAPGGQAGLNAGIFWDGANGEGDIVLNGVYIAYIEAKASGLTAKLKIAVVK